MDRPRRHCQVSLRTFFVAITAIGLLILPSQRTLRWVWGKLRRSEVVVPDGGAVIIGATMWRADGTRVYLNMSRIATARPAPTETNAAPTLPADGRPSPMMFTPLIIIQDEDAELATRKHDGELRDTISSGHNESLLVESSNL